MGPGPTEVAGKYFITEVVKRTPAKTQGLNEVRSQIQGQLDQELQQRFFADFASDYQSKWLSRTFCADGYLIEKCCNHIDDGRPPSAVAACYEADPKGGRPVDCPAPVQQAAPVLPGSTSEAKPDGERLPQRPRPAGLKETPAPALPGGVAPPPIAE